MTTIINTLDDDGYRQHSTVAATTTNAPTGVLEAGTYNTGDKSFSLLFPVPRHIESIQAVTLRMRNYIAEADAQLKFVATRESYHFSFPGNGSLPTTGTIAKRVVGFGTDPAADQVESAGNYQFHSIDMLLGLRELLDDGYLVHRKVRIDCSGNLPTDNEYRIARYYAPESSAPSLELDYTPKALVPILTTAGESLVANHGLSGSLQMRLFTNDVGVDRDTLLTNLTEASWTGYEPAPVSVGSITEVNGQSEAPLTMANFRNETVSATTAYGWYLTSALAPSAPIVVRVFEDPLVVTAGAAKGIQTTVSIVSVAG